MWLGLGVVVRGVDAGGEGVRLEVRVGKGGCGVEVGRGGVSGHDFGWVSVGECG